MPPWFSAAVGILLALPLSGCLGGRDARSPTESGIPAGFDEETPSWSRLADVPYYDLTHSTSFVLKGWSYGRYVVRVAQPVEDVQVFFSTSNSGNGGRGPSLDDPDAYHFEFMQIRPLAREIKTAGVDAVSQFRHAGTSQVFTLTYIYGKDANYQFLAPYDGDPNRWRFEPGYYEFVITTDEKLTVGINVRTTSPYWSTYYHPQELGEARAEALDFHGELLQDVGGRLPDRDVELRGIIRTSEGERFNYFAFADVWYDTKAFALGTTATTTVSVDGQDMPHQLAVEPPGPQRDEAYAFAVHFNGVGPGQVDLRAHALFHEDASVGSTAVVLLMVFGLATIALETLPGLPTESGL